MGSAAISNCRHGRCATSSQWRQSSVEGLSTVGLAAGGELTVAFKSRCRAFAPAFDAATDGARERRFWEGS